MSIKCSASIAHFVQANRNAWNVIHCLRSIRIYAEWVLTPIAPPKDAPQKLVNEIKNLSQLTGELVQSLEKVGTCFSASTGNVVKVLNSSHSSWHEATYQLAAATISLSHGSIEWRNGATFNFAILTGAATVDEFLSSLSSGHAKALATSLVASDATVETCNEFEGQIEIEFLKAVRIFCPNQDITKIDYQATPVRRGPKEKSPAAKLAKAKLVKKERDAFRKRYSREPTPQELAGAFKMKYPNDRGFSASSIRSILNDLNDAQIIQ